jgi:hypothetical protein
METVEPDEALDEKAELEGDAEPTAILPVVEPLEPVSDAEDAEDSEEEEDGRQ